jgi:tripartite-type tricarboxylate transporter receptor subunit TctC
MAKRILLVLTMGLLVASMSVWAGGTSEGAAEFPTRPITLVCGSGVGGGTDSMMRGIMPYFEKYIGVQVKGENRTGAHGVIAANYVYKQKPDGYTLFAMNNPYEIDIMMNPDKEKTGVTSLLVFEPVCSWLNADGNAFAVRKGDPIQTMEQMAAEAKKRTLNVALAGGVGSSDHITYLMAIKVYGGDYQFVPYDSGGEAISALLGKHVDVAVVSLSGDAVTPETIDLLATTLGDRVPHFPDTPTFEELGHPELSLSFHVGAMAPPGTPREIIATLEAAFEKAFYDPGYQEWAKKTGKPIGDFYGTKRWGDFLAQYSKSLTEMMPVIEEAMAAE